MNFVSSVKQFNKTVWLIIIASFSARFTFFMIWPFMALILFQKFGLSEFEIGGFLAISAFVGSIFGFFAGNLSDRFGRRKIILIGLLVQVSSLITLGFAEGLGIMLLGSVGQSIARSMIENPGKALMTDMMQTRAVKDLALHVRYFALNVGAAFGPILGVFAGVTGQQTTFFITAGFYIAYFGAAAIIFTLEKPDKRSNMAGDYSFKTLFSLLAQDHAFLIFVLANLIMFATYAQIDAGLLQYLRLEGVTDIKQLFAMLIFINGATVIVLQFPVLKMLENIKPLRRSIYGIIISFFAHVTFAFTPLDTPYFLILAMFLLSVGEVILFPTINILIDRMAPENLKGSYFGAAGLSSFGFSLAPIMGGFLLHEYGGEALWLTMAALCILVGLLLYVAQNAKRPEVLKLDND